LTANKSQKAKIRALQGGEDVNWYYLTNKTGHTHSFCWLRKRFHGTVELVKSPESPLLEMWSFLGNTYMDFVELLRGIEHG